MASSLRLRAVADNSPPPAAAQADAGARRRARRRYLLKKWVPVYIMAAPGLLYLLINNYMPLMGLFIAFKQVNFQQGIFASPWVGLKNFEFLFKTKDAWIITRNTLGYNLLFITLNLVLGVTFAIFISDIRRKGAKRLYQSMVLLPHLMSTVIISYIVYAVLSPDKGMMNNTVLPLLERSAISWYNEPRYWPFILAIVNTWKSIGYGCLVYISGIAAIDGSFYEAAVLDGATKWQQIRFITLPCLKTSIITLLLLNIGRIFYSDFGLFYQVPMNSGTLFSATNTIDTYVYRALLQLGNIGMSAAAGFYQSVVGFILIFTCNMIIRKIDRDSAIF